MSIKKFIVKDLDKNSYQSLVDCANAIKEKDNILICAHASPDGDALGSSFAFAYICKALGKNFALYNESEIPDFLSFLPLPSELYNDLDNLPFKPNLLVMLDCGDRNRLGLHADKLLKIAPSISIDHHMNNPLFGSYLNWVDTNFSATGVAIGCLALELDIPLKDELGFCVYTSLVTDTGSFSYGNTNALCQFLAGHIISQGVDPSTISSSLNNQWTEEKTKLWSYLLSNYTIDKELSIAYILVSKAILKQYNCSKDDLEGFVEQLRKIKNTRIACIMREKSSDETKVSFRSQADDDVQKLASFFGGGGHKNAAGATIKSSLQDAKKSILETLEKNIKEILPNK